jgi:hypothetical protein
MFQHLCTKIINLYTGMCHSFVVVHNTAWQATQYRITQTYVKLGLPQITQLSQITQFIPITLITMNYPMLPKLVWIILNYPKLP